MSENDPQTDKLSAKLSAPALFSDPDFLSAAPIRLRPVDLATLLGISRARVSQLVKAGRLKPFPDGTLCPSAVARALIRTEHPKAARSKILVTIREEVNDARNCAAQATAARDRLAAHHAALLEAFRTITTRWLVSERWLDGFYDGLENAGVDDVLLAETFAAACNSADAADWAELTRRTDPEVLQLIADVDPANPVAAVLKDRQIAAAIDPAMQPIMDRPYLEAVALAGTTEEQP